MRLAVTGTPGTGKTTATELLAERFADAPEVIHLNERIKGDDDLWTERDDARGGSRVVDLEAVSEELGDWEGILESHLAHHFDADAVVVLRCDPAVIEERLRERGESAESAAENAESEALDVVLAEAVERFGRENVYEVDTTNRSPAAVADAIHAVLTGDREPSAGTVDFTGYL